MGEASLGRADHWARTPQATGAARFGSERKSAPTRQARRRWSRARHSSRGLDRRSRYSLARGRWARPLSGGKLLVRRSGVVEWGLGPSGHAPRLAHEASHGPPPAPSGAASRRGPAGASRQGLPCGAESGSLADARTSSHPPVRLRPVLGGITTGLPTQFQHQPCDACCARMLSFHIDLTQVNTAMGNLLRNSPCRQAGRARGFAYGNRSMRREGRRQEHITCGMRLLLTRRS